MSNLKEVKSYMSDKMINIPEFINSTSSIHYLVWNSLCEINSILLKLISNSIIREATICKLVEKTNLILDDMYDIIPNGLQMNVIAYFSKMVIWLERVCIHNELYEAAANIKRYDNIYHKISPII